MKTRILTLFLVLISSVTFSQSVYTPHYQSLYDPGLFDIDMTMVTEVAIDGTTQNVNYLEVGVFCGETVCGYGMLSDEGRENYLAYVQLCGFPNQVLTFKLWNHQIGAELDLVCTTTVETVTDGTFGSLDEPFMLNFVTPATCTFTNVDGNNWSTEANWSPRIPASCDDAVVAANSICVIDDDATVAYKTLTIKDGAQFVGDGEEYEVTFEKEIAAYTPGTRNNYYFIANPTDGKFLETENLLEGIFDLYFFDSEGVDEETEEETREWQNYVTYNADPEYWGPFASSDNGNGYLYANSQNTTLRFTGVANDASASISYTISYTSGENFPGFHLLGNTLPCNVAVTGGTKISGYYTMSGLRKEVVPIENPIVAPCTSFFAELGSSGGNANARKVTLTPSVNGTLNTRNITSLINIEVNDNSGLLDRAYVRFNEQENLQKFTLNPNAPHIFFREEGKDYAIVQGNERMSQLPLFFETREYGTYTINVKLEKMSCEYLHLIDNLTGMDVDLNVTPSYTFQANSSDYAARFKIVFEGTGVEENTANESFAIVEGNRVIIPAIEHESTLEVIDMTGRTVSSQKVNGSFDQTLNVKAGLYILNLNGMTQKIVIE